MTDLISTESIIIIGTLIFFVRRNFARRREGKRGKVAHWMRGGGGSFGNTTIVEGGGRNGGAGFVSGVMVRTEQGQDLLANENQNTGRVITIDISRETETVAANGIDGGNGRQRGMLNMQVDGKTCLKARRESRMSVMVVRRVWRGGGHPLIGCWIRGGGWGIGGN
jgi:hypothetical protein